MKKLYFGKLSFLLMATFCVASCNNAFINGITDKFIGSTNKSEEKWNKNHGVVPTISNDGKTITYGMYPQTRVNNSVLINKLDSLTDYNDYGYYFSNKNYYYKYNATPHFAGYSFDNGTAIKSDITYWFKVEPIKWKVLENNDGEYFVTSESLLVNHIYNSWYKGTQSKTDYQGNTASVYQNNYKYSEIRSWLNTDFYNQAFFLGDDNIKVSNVDNGVLSVCYSPNSYVCEDTSDKLFLLSEKELTNTAYGFSTSESDEDVAKVCKATDYAKAHGVYYSTSSNYLNNGWYWTRSPDYLYSSNSIIVHCDGRVCGDAGVSNSYYGVRPALRLSL